MPPDDLDASVGTTGHLDFIQHPIWTVVLLLAGPDAQPGDGGTYVLRAPDPVHALAAARAHWINDYDEHGRNPAQLVPVLISQNDCRDATSHLVEARRKSNAARLATLTTSALSGYAPQVTRSVH